MSTKAPKESATENVFRKWRAKLHRLLHVGNVILEQFPDASDHNSNLFVRQSAICNRCKCYDGFITVDSLTPQLELSGRSWASLISVFLCTEYLQYRISIDFQQIAPKKKKSHLILYCHHVCCPQRNKYHNEGLPSWISSCPSLLSRSIHDVAHYSTVVHTVMYDVNYVLLSSDIGLSCRYHLTEFF